MFKRRRKGTQKTEIVKEKKIGWFRKLFKKKVVSPENNVKQKKKAHGTSVITLFRNKIQKSKLVVKDIELIEGVDTNDLKRKYSIHGTRGKLLEGMVADYKQGRISLPGLSHKSKFHDKPLNKARLNQMLNEYERTKKQKTLAEVQNNVKVLKKKFSMSAAQAKKLDKVVQDLGKQKVSKLEIANELLDPNKLTKERVNKFIKQYEEAQKKKRGVSYMITQSKLLLMLSKQKIHNLMEDQGFLKKYM